MTTTKTNTKQSAEAELYGSDKGVFSLLWGNLRNMLNMSYNVTKSGDLSTRVLVDKSYELHLTTKAESVKAANTLRTKYQEEGISLEDNPWANIGKEQE